MTESQMFYITKMKKDNPELPPFTGHTRGDAAEYIEKHKQGRNYKGKE